MCAPSPRERNRSQQKGRLKDGSCHKERSSYRHVWLRPRLRFGGQNRDEREGTTLLGLAMYEDPKSQGADHGGDSGVRQRQSVPSKQGEGHGADIAASFAKPTSSQVVPTTEFDHVQANQEDS